MSKHVPKIKIHSPSPLHTNEKDNFESKKRKSKNQNSKSQTRMSNLAVITTNVERKKDEDKMSTRKISRLSESKDSENRHSLDVYTGTDIWRKENESKDKSRKNGLQKNSVTEEKAKIKTVVKIKEGTSEGGKKKSTRTSTSIQDSRNSEDILQKGHKNSTLKSAKLSMYADVRQKVIGRIERIKKQESLKSPDSSVPEIEQKQRMSTKNITEESIVTVLKEKSRANFDIKEREKIKVNSIGGVVILNTYDRRRQYDQVLKRRTKAKAELDRLKRKGKILDTLRESDEHRYAEASLQNDNSFERFNDNVSFNSYPSVDLTNRNLFQKRKLSATVKPMIRNDLNKKVQILSEKEQTCSTDSQSSVMNRNKTFTKDKTETTVPIVPPTHAAHSKAQVNGKGLHTEESMTLSKELEFRDTNNQKLKYHPQIHNRVHDKRHVRMFSEVERTTLNRENRLDLLHGNQRKSGDSGTKLHDPSRIVPHVSSQTKTSNNNRKLGFAERYILQPDDNTGGIIDIKHQNNIPNTMNYEQWGKFQTHQRLGNSSFKSNVLESGMGNSISFDKNMLTQNHVYTRKSFLEIVIKPDSFDGIAFKESLNPNTEDRGSTHVYVKSGKVSAFLHPYNQTDGSDVHRSQSEIPVYSDDEFDVYNPQRPHTDTYRELPLGQGRYEEKNQNNDSPQKPHRTLNGKGKLVTFYRNGDEYFKGLTISITPKNFLNFETLLVYLNDKIETTTGVKYIFAYPSGKEVKSVTEFLPGRCYLVSTNKKPILNIAYGRKSKEQHWVNRKPSGGPMRKGEQELFRKPNDHIALKHLKPRVVTVLKNEERDRKEKVYINPVTKQTFEDLMITIGDMIEEEIHALYTEKKPYKKVESYSQLFNEFKNHDEFIACGPELYPSEKRTIPSSNSSSDYGWKKRFSRLNERGDLGELDENDADYSLSPVPNMDHNGMLTSRDLPLMPPHRPMADDWVKFEIKGKDRYYYPPTVVYPDDNGERPGKKLKLEWLYGYRGKEGSQSLMVYEPTGELLYYMAAVAIFLWVDDRVKDGDTARDAQRHYLGHTDDITCLTIHPNEFLVASGQCSSKNSPAHVRIWDGRQLTTHHVIGLDFFVSGISSIDFSQQSSGNFMCVSDSSDKHILSVWDWSRERLIAKTTTTNQVVNCACFYKYDDTLLITYGAEHLYFWRLFWDPVIEREGKLYRDKLSGVFKEVPKNITAHAFTSNGDVITGDSTGSIIIWTKDSEYVFKMNKNLSADTTCVHTHSVTSLCMMNDDTCLSGGGTCIKAWDHDFKCISEREISDTSGHVRAIIPQRRSRYDGKIFVGTSKSCIFGGSLLHKFKYIVFGHSDEVWCVQHSVMRDQKRVFFTAGQDRLVIKWLPQSHRKDWKFEVDAPISAMSVDTCEYGQFVAVGTVIGRFTVLRVSNGEPLLSVHCSAAQINAMSYSPDCSKLSLGTYDGYIHVFRVYDEGEHYRKMKVPLKGHETFINNIDWSANSKYLRSCDADFDEKFWNTQYMEPDHGDTLRNCNWETHTCCADYAVMGPWTACEENETLSVVSRSHNRDIMSVGDNKGRIKLYKYPSSKHMPSSRWTKLYSSTVTALDFLSSDTHLISCAGKYPVLAQWAVVDTAVGN